MIYFDNAATTIHKPPTVLQAVSKALTLGNPSRGVHQASLEASRIVYQCRKMMSDFFHCSKSNQVIFTPNATGALNLAILGLFGEGDHIITSDWEHNSVLRPLYHLMEEKGVEISVMNSDKFGLMDLDQLHLLKRDNTKGVVLSHMSNVTGNILDIEKVGAFAKKYNLLFILDVAQSAGLVPIDMQRMGIDLLAFTGHKHLLGPQGIGGLCIEGAHIPKPLLYGGTGIHSYLQKMPEVLPEGLEAGTLNLVGISGLMAGVNFLQEEGLEIIEKKVYEITQAFYEGVKQLPKVIIYGAPQQKDLRKHNSIISINLEGMSASTLADTLSFEYEIATRTGAHCAPLMHQSMGTYPEGCVRFSFSHTNTLEEVVYTLDCLKKISRCL